MTTQASGLDVMTQLRENRADPYPLFAWLRAHDPVHRTPDGIHLITRHADVTRVLQDSGTTFLSPDRAMLEAQFPDAPRHRSVRMFASSIALTNPPEHTRLRKVLSREFTARRVEDLRPRIEQVCDRLLNDITPALLDGEVVDLHDRLAQPLSIATLAGLLGIPAGDQEWLSSLVEAVLSAYPGAPEEVLAVADEHCAQLEEYLAGLIEFRGRVPADDLTTALAGKTELGAGELVPMLWALWCAGFRTAAGGIGNGVLAMLRNPDESHWLRGGRDEVGAFVNEALRFLPPTVITPFLRIATRDTELVPARSTVRLVLGAANRDPMVFDAPGRFDPARDTRASLAFSGGIHFCVGAGLARTEMSVCLPRLHERFPNLAAAGEPDWSEAVFHHMVRGLPVST